MPNCPICGRELGENDRLIVEYYAPKNWWVLYHSMDVNKDYTDGSSTITTEKPNCGRANVVIDHPIPFQLRGTDWISF